MNTYQMNASHEKKVPEVGTFFNPRVLSLFARSVDYKAGPNDDTVMPLRRTFLTSVALARGYRINRPPGDALCCRDGSEALIADSQAFFPNQGG